MLDCANSFVYKIDRRTTDTTLEEAILGQEYIIKSIVTNDEELNAFLFSLGRYSGNPIAVVSHRENGCVVS